ncbi:MAG: TerB family tellurite resistance protein [Myxococcales bacterium]|nr:TerB family tellurite resistance protein [Myxococcales bacterium]
MKVRDRIGVIVDLLMGALSCDGTIIGEEDRAARRLLGDLLLVPPDALPPEVEERIQRFRLIDFDMDRVVADFLSDPPMKKRRLLELIAKMVDADGEHDLREDDFIRDLARALGMAPSEYEDLVLLIEVQELDPDGRLKSMRDSFLDLRISDIPAEPPAAKPASVPPPIPPEARKP